MSNHENTTNPESILKKEFENKWRIFLSNNKQAILDPFLTAKSEVTKFTSKLGKFQKDISGLMDSNHFTVLQAEKSKNKNLDYTWILSSKSSMVAYEWIKLRLAGQNPEIIKAEDVEFKVNPKLKSIPALIMDENEWQKDILNVLLKEENLKLSKIALFLLFMSQRLGEVLEGLDNLAKDGLYLEIVNREKQKYQKAAIGCLEKCPNCFQICDVDHNENPGEPDDLHACYRGHRAFGTSGTTINDRLDLKHCSQLRDDSLLVVNGDQVKWGDLKKGSPWNQWDYSRYPLDFAPKQKKAWKIRQKNL
eukprot:TRINITY_DN12659_c0_g3_i12.p1 TRINITY_DN12659_c0_g3~~TRINITY_DN12659_c0_g3_i12.p1  ORF type:complete len:306 (-),score=23.05 TRINITY_DN12659_c0_g3_i12:151-1068(-)